MVVVMMVNSTSGRGHGREIADRLRAALESPGRTVRGVDLSASDAERRESMRGAEAAIAVGGDGTLRTLAEIAIETQTPVYHAPAGTENLFARQFAMDAEPTTLLAALRERRIARVDVGFCGQHRFLLMASLGVDASVIHRLSASRTGSIRHLSYAGPILAELRNPYLPCLEVEADGRAFVQGVRGLLIVANSRQYAMRLDPAPEAAMDDGLLDCVFMPIPNRRALVGWGVRAVLGRHRNYRRLMRSRVRSVRVRIIAGGACLQLDGEAEPTACSYAPEDLILSVDPGSLRVLLPAGDPGQAGT